MDTGLKDKLLTDECKSQMLTWVIKGSVKWYKEELGQPPRVMQAAFQGYVDENGYLAKFLQLHCIEGQELLVESVTLLERYNFYNVPITASKLKSKMAARGFIYKNVSRIGLKRGNYYIGIALVEQA